MFAAAQDAASDVIKLVSKVEPAEFARPGILPDGPSDWEALRLAIQNVANRDDQRADRRPL